MTRKLISSGTAWERKYGYSRAVQVDNLVVVAGTTAVDEHGRIVGPGHPKRQAKFISRASVGQFPMCRLPDPAGFWGAAS